MFVTPPDGIVGRTRINFTIGNINLKKKGLDVVLTSQPGMLQGRDEQELVGIPQNLQVGGAAREATGTELGKILAGHLGHLNVPSKLDNLVILIDTSTSMTFGNRLALIEQQIEKLGPFIPAGTKVSVVQFDKEARTVVNTVTIDNANEFDKKIVRSIEQLDVRGGTRIDKALVAASNQIRSADGYDHEHPERNLIVLITDGDHRPRVLEEYKKVYGLAQGITPFRNAPLVVVGVGTDYNAELVQSIAGFSGGFFFHTSKDNKADIFGKLIPSLIKQITGSDFYIRCDAYESNRVWATDPSIQEVAFRGERQGIHGTQGAHELRGGFLEKPTFISVFDPDNSESVVYFLAGQQDARLCFGSPNEIIIPDDPGRELEIVPLGDLPPELRADAKGNIAKWLEVLAIQKRDLAALYALHKAGIVSDKLYERLNDLLKAHKEDNCRSAETDIGTGHLSIGPGISQIKPSGEESEEGLSSVKDPGFEDKLKDLGKIKIPNELRISSPKIFLPESMIGGHSFVDENHGLTLHSGVLGPLSIEPQNTILPFVQRAVEAYNQAQPAGPIIKFEIEKVLGTGNIIPIGLFNFSNKTTYTIGRNKACDIRVSNESASKRHCEIIKLGDEIIIRDLNSRNGTYVNGNKITEAKLKNGDQVAVGLLVFKVTI
ncbi:MAG: FHA domain-containing protein [Candidatus Melainabacteria bacterium]|nr:FHA domain-containing protein [Candidatus Melainabacteria bacterium]